VLASCLFGLLFVPEDGGSTFLRNIAELLVTIRCHIAKDSTFDCAAANTHCHSPEWNSGNKQKASSLVTLAVKTVLKFIEQELLKRKADYTLILRAQDAKLHSTISFSFSLALFT
jgi:hypothetical protein